MSGASALLTVEDLCFRYGSNEVLKGINLHMEEGEALCLLGPNGCGKTTLLDCLLKINAPASGKILYGGQNLSGLKVQELARMAAYVPQMHNSSFPFSVFDFVLMGRTAYTGPLDAPGAEDREIVREILDEMGLAELADRDYSRLSGGETRMVLIARALVQDSPLLIMDEPGSHLDYRNEIMMLEIILTLISRKKRSVLMTTHSPQQVYFLESCGIPVRSAMIKDGTICGCGRPEDILKPELLMDIFGVRTALVGHKEGNRTYRNIIPIPRRGEGAGNNPGRSDL